MNRTVHVPVGFVARSPERNLRCRNLTDVNAIVDVPAADLRPRLRGWLHVWAGAVSVATGMALISVAGAVRGERAGLATAVYAVSVLALFSTSATYHRVRWSTRGHSVMKRLDHSMIFVLIAGTYTPFALLGLPWHIGRVVLAVVWLGATAGVILKMAWPHAPRALGVPLYLALGWVGVFVFPPLLRGVGVTGVAATAPGRHRSRPPPLPAATAPGRHRSRPPPLPAATAPGRYRFTIAGSRIGRAHSRSCRSTTVTGWAEVGRSYHRSNCAWFSPPSTTSSDCRLIRMPSRLGGVLVPSASITGLCIAWNVWNVPSRLMA